jgi:peptide/nickel transport system substrate-binding protein
MMLFYVKGGEKAMTTKYRSEAWVGRRLSRRGVVRGAALGAVGAALAGCASSSAPAPAATAPPAAVAAAPTTAAAAQPKRGGTIKTMSTTSERNLEPHISGGVGTLGAVGPLVCYSQLLTYKWGPDVKAPAYIPTGDLAESWTKPDDTTYVFKLRPGVKWHNIAPVNGRDLVADDIVYSLQRIRDLKSFADYINGVTKFEAVDKSTLKLTLDKPNPDLLDSLANHNIVMVPKERVEQTGGKLDDPPLIGSGPFIFDSWTLNQRFTAKRNPDYYVKGQPYIDGIESYRASDPAQMPNSFRGGQTNALCSGLGLTAAEDLKKNLPNINLFYILVDRAPLCFGLNSNLDKFKDVRVRQALGKAIDRKAIFDAVWLGKGGLGTLLSVPDPSYKLPEAELNKLLARDVAGAKQLLSQAGVTSLSFEITSPNYASGAYVSAAELVQANLREIGVTATLRPQDAGTWAATQLAGSYEGAVFPANPTNINATLYALFYTGAGQNWVKYSDPTLDMLIDQQAQQVRDPEARKKIINDVERRYIEDAVYIPLGTYQTPLALVPEIKDFYLPTIINFHLPVWNTVWFDK